MIVLGPASCPQVLQAPPTPACPSIYHLSTCCAMLVTPAPAHWHTGMGIIRNQNKSDENNTSGSPTETVCPPSWRNFQSAGGINTSKSVTEDSDIGGGKTWVPVRENPRFSGETPSHNHKIAAPSPAARKKGLHPYCLCVKCVLGKLKSRF